MKRLIKMLSHTRDHGSVGERVFTKKFIMPYKPTAFFDPEGNALALVIDVADKHSVVPPVLWSSHLDTVHLAKDPQRQHVQYDEGCGLMYKTDGMPLGADNAAGVWLLLNMIDAKVPGSYIFHRGEECGGIGSRGMAVHHRTFLEQFKYAIAFDRKGTSNVITEQMCGVCCSDAFALALAGALNTVNEEFMYEPDNTGSFTDTANYVKIIPECTNVSVGYEDEHSPNETLDVWHLMALRAAVIEAFQEGTGILPVERDPTKPSKGTRIWSFGNFAANDSPMTPETAADVLVMGFKELVGWVRMTDPDEVADFIYSLAESVDDATYQSAREQYDNMEASQLQHLNFLDEEY